MSIIWYFTNSIVNPYYHYKNKVTVSYAIYEPHLSGAVGAVSMWDVSIVYPSRPTSYYYPG